MINIIKNVIAFFKDKKIEDKEEYYVIINLEKVKKMKFARPSRRSNGCSGDKVELSNRIINSVERL